MEIFVYIVNLIVDVFVGIVSRVIGILPNPPFTLAGAINGLSVMSTVIPVGLFIPYLVTISGLVTLRLGFGGLRTFVKGWL
jgi:hypothetical protein